MSDDPLEIVGVTLDGRFRVDSLVTDDELSLVYRALDLTGHVPVAIRCLHLPTTLDVALAGPFVESFNERTKRHARLGAGHPVFVKLLGSGSTTARSTGLAVPYEVREWLEATTLTSYIAKRRAKGESGWPLDFVVAALDPVADGLTYAHAMGIVHGAVNPNNLVVVEGGGRPSVRIMDFGDARSEETSNLRPVLRVLIPEYTAPEQVDKQIGSLGPWTDVFALAVIVLECLAGTLGTKGKAASMLVEPENRPTPRKLGLSLAPAVEEVLDRALDLAPHSRPQDVATFWSELKAAGGLAASKPSATAKTVLATPPVRPTSKPPLPVRARPNPLVKATLVGLAPQKPLAPQSPKLYSPAPTPSPVMLASAPLPVIAAPSIAPPTFSEDEGPTKRRDGLPGSEATGEPRLSPPPPPIFSEPPPPDLYPTAVGAGSLDEPELFMPALGRPSLALRLRKGATWVRDWIGDKAIPWVVARARDREPRARAQFGVTVAGGFLFLCLCMTLCLGRGASKASDRALPLSASGAYGSAPPSAATPPASAQAIPEVPAPPAPSDIPVDVPPPVALPAPAAAPPSTGPVAFTKAAASAALEAAGADLSECRQLGALRGPGSIRVTFAKSGAVARITIGPPYADTPEGACILDRFGRAQMPSLRGPGSLNYTFSVPK
jgi:eukaryotic-like serine/threonine-protein kinase